MQSLLRYIKISIFSYTILKEQIDRIIAMCFLYNFVFFFIKKCSNKMGRAFCPKKVYTPGSKQYSYQPYC